MFFAIMGFCNVIFRLNRVIMLFNQVYTQGYISLGSMHTSFSVDQDLTHLNASVIAPFWADIDVETTGAIFYR